MGLIFNMTTPTERVKIVAETKEDAMAQLEVVIATAFEGRAPPKPRVRKVRSLGKPVDVSTLGETPLDDA